MARLISTSPAALLKDMLRLALSAGMVQGRGCAVAAPVAALVLWS